MSLAETRPPRNPVWIKLNNARRGGFALFCHQDGTIFAVHGRCPDIRTLANGLDIGYWNANVCMGHMVEAMAAMKANQVSPQPQASTHPARHPSAPHRRRITPTEVPATEVPMEKGLEALKAANAILKKRLNAALKMIETFTQDSSL